jgi:uncharacterized protein YkwD
MGIMDRINVHYILAFGLKIIAATAICLLAWAIVPASQLHSQNIDGWPAEQSSPAEMPADGAPNSAESNTSMNANAMSARVFVPLLTRAGQAATPQPNALNPLDTINAFRTAAGLSRVTLVDTLNNNCWLHSRYMAEENEIAHSERTSSRWYTAEGQSCGQNSNVWLGSEFSRPIWQPANAIESWMASVGHRMWLLYPTTPAFGFSFYTAANNRAGAALDVLSRVDTSKDTSYAGWPVRYPAPNQTGIPAQAYSITLGWRYFGATPAVSSISLTANGAPIPFSYTTSLPVNHKGIEIKPSLPLPANSTINVSVAGSYDGKPFSYQWSFKTAS